MSTDAPTTYTPSELDDVLFLPDQDVHEPVWEDDADVAGMQNVDDPNDQFAQAPLEVRTAFGVLDFMHDLVEETHEALGTIGGSTPPVKQPKLDAIRTRELGSDTWRPRTQTVNLNPSEIAAQTSTRRKITIVNYGPSIVYISNMTSPGVATPNQFPIPVSGAAFYAPVCLSTKDKIYATAALASVVSFIEEFDLES